jgi:alkaline phosphatase D
MIAGDSHANWVSDLVWLGDHDYDQKTGEGSIGVEFAGTAVSSPSPAGQNISLAAANAASRQLVSANRELQWSELYYRGYYELYITKKEVTAQYFGMPTIVNQNANEISLANFTVVSGQNRLSRTNGVAGGGVVENGALQRGQTKMTNATHDTSSGKWFVSHENVEDI